MEENTIAQNSNITQYQSDSKALCMNADKKAKPLQYDKDNLLKRYPNLGNKELLASDFFNEIINKEFVDGITKRVFIRNYTLEKNSSYLRLAFRPERTPNDYLSLFMPPDKTLLFRGRVTGNFFVVDGVTDHYAEELLPYEIECNIRRYDDENRVRATGGNFLYNLAEESASLNEYTQQRLTEWRNYIEWRRVLVKARMNGKKYIRVESREDNLVFTLQLANKEEFEAERKWLQKGELAAYNEKDYSDENGKFNYDDKDNSKEKFQPLGIFVRRARREGRQVGEHFEIDLTYAAPDIDELEEMDAEERAQYVQNHLLPRYPKTGFLAPLVIKDLSLFSRLDTAANNLQRDFYCSSPNLAMWIFDVTRARLPKPQNRAEWERKVGDDWLNKSVAQNKNQREAIFKMLAAPDLCLIQGPPGTGKTTVIAEAIYQFVKQGNRVLLASQSHDAVDNALDRLARRSEVRAVRLGERTRYDEKSTSFSKSKILSTYYGCLAQSIEDSYLRRWEDNRRQYDGCEMDLRDWQSVYEALENLNRKLRKNGGEQQQLRKELSMRREEIEQAQAEEQDHEAANRQYQSFADKVNDDENFDDLYLSESAGDIFAECFSPIIKSASELGIKLFSFEENVIRREPNLFLRTIAATCKQIKILRDRLAKTQQNAVTDSGIAQLKLREIERKIKEISDQMEEADREQWEELKTERNRLRAKKEQLRDSGSLTFTDEELNLFDAPRREQLKSSKEINSIVQNMNAVIEDYCVALKNSVQHIGESLDAYQPKDTRDLQEQEKSLRGRIKFLGEEATRLRNEIAEKEHLGQTLSEKYSCERADIEERIEAEMNRLNSEWRRDSEIRDVWANTLYSFTNRLRDEKTAKYDEGFFSEIYLQTCNVVGITCAANMRRELGDNFSEFDVVIIDEVSKATPPELLQPLMRGRKTILVGDHRQLSPVFDEYESSYNELLEKINSERTEDDDDDAEDAYNLQPEDLEKYRNMVTASLFREYFEQADDRIKHSLLTQYRMHSDIQRVINRFYDGKLESGLLETENTLKAHGLKISTDRGESFLRPDTHAYWIDSSTLRGKPMEQSRYTGSTSLHNIFERYIICAILRKLNEAYSALGRSGVTVGVISFYGSQVGDLRKAVKALRNEGKLKALKVDVNTVDRFQGKEKQIIITSLVCNTKRGNASRHVAAFERINVAFSRAQNLLIIVGAKALYEKLNVNIPDMETGEQRSAHIYQNIIDDIARGGALIPGEALISDEEVEAIREEYDKEANEL